MDRSDRQAGADEITEEMVERACEVLRESGLLYFEVFEKEPCPITVRVMLQAALGQRSKALCQTRSTRNRRRATLAATGEAARR